MYWQLSIYIWELLRRIVWCWSYTGYTLDGYLPLDEPLYGWAWLTPTDDYLILNKWKGYTQQWTRIHFPPRYKVYHQQRITNPYYPGISVHADSGEFIIVRRTPGALGFREQVVYQGAELREGIV